MYKRKTFLISMYLRGLRLELVIHIGVSYLFQKTYLWFYTHAKCRNLIETFIKKMFPWVKLSFPFSYWNILQLMWSPNLFTFSKRTFNFNMYFAKCMEIPLFYSWLQWYHCCDDNHWSYSTIIVLCQSFSVMDGT